MSFFLNNPYLLGLGALTLVNMIFLAILWSRFWLYQKTQRALLADEEIGDLAGIVLKHKKSLATHNKNLKEIGKILEELVEQNHFNLQKVGLVRFNPFADTGGNISFAIALLDGRGNGIVISSLHGREGTRIYAKPVEKGESKHHLTGEEKEAITQAKNYR